MWGNYRKLVIHKDAPQIQLDECRQAFFAGASVLFTSIVDNLSAGRESTKQDEDFLKSINSELYEFGLAFDQKKLGFNRESIRASKSKKH